MDRFWSGQEGSYPAQQERLNSSGNFILLNPYIFGLFDLFLQDFKALIVQYGGVEVYCFSFQFNFDTLLKTCWQQLLNYCHIDFC